MKISSFVSRIWVLYLAVLIFGLLVVGFNSTQAATINFTKITNNGPDNVASQLSADVTSSSGKILFEFKNAGPLASVIGQVYVDDDKSVLSNMTILDDTNPETSLGVAFHSGATPANLPSGNLVVPPFVADFSAGADNPSPSNGVNPTEMLGILFDGNLANALAGLADGSLRLGLHVQGIGTTGNSDAFVSVPEPASASLALMSLVFAALSYRRRAV